MKYYRIQHPKVEQAITDFNDGKINEIELCSIIYQCHPYKWEHVVRWATESIDEVDLHDVLTVDEESILEHLAQKYGDKYLSRFKKPKAEEYQYLPYRLYIYANLLKDTIVGECNGSGGPDFLFEPKCVKEQVYYNYYYTKQEALDKWDEKYSQYVKEILDSGYYDCWPVYNVTMTIVRGDNIIKCEQYNINQNK